MDQLEEELGTDDSFHCYAIPAREMIRLHQPRIFSEELKGTASQTEWAERIRRQVDAEFDRVAAAFEQAAAKQSKPDRMDTEAIIAILEKKRVEVLAKDQAGYFIHDWQELGDQVRQMIHQDPAYQAIKAARESRSRASRSEQIVERSGIE
jgi:hypothetical protein